MARLCRGALCGADIQVRFADTTVCAVTCSAGDTDLYSEAVASAFALSLRTAIRLMYSTCSYACLPLCS